MVVGLRSEALAVATTVVVALSRSFLSGRPGEAHGFRSRTLDVGLTASVVVQRLGDADSSRKAVIFLRVRVYIEDARKEAELPAIGLEVANYLLDALPKMEQTAMMIWQDRDHRAVLVGSVRDRLTFRQVLGANIAAMLLAVVAGFLLVGLFAAVLIERTDPTQRAQFLESDWVDWFNGLLDLSVPRSSPVWLPSGFCCGKDGLDRLGGRLAP